MTYPHLENAPKDHLSDEFLEYLRATNVVVADNDHFLIVENCKHHTPEAPHLTAFVLDSHGHWFDFVEELYAKYRYDGYDLLIKAPHRQSVRRPHVHLIKRG